ncbi:MAG TPA: ATP synthase F0 subunit B [Terriglobia bacterium]|jgi:F-type H+-transporting ATPase subunit b|nr:ATP synthase F0 subunit B [Terriglobia bacterium]
MGNIGHEIGQAFVQAIPTVVLVALLVYVLRRVFFRPLAAVMKARDEQSKGAVARARERATQAEARAAEYEALWLKARQEVYSQREGDRKQAVEARDKVVQQARAQAEATVKAAQTDLAAQAERARGELAQTSAALADEIARVVLSGARPADGAGEIRH